MNKTKHKHGLSSFHIIFCGFLLLILLGSFVLILPISSANSEYTPFTDALFTATSAVCVTGLVVYDTATYWSGFGQAVILILIQLGGLGVVTLMFMFFLLSKQKISLHQRQTMQDSMGSHQLGGIVRLSKFVISVIFSIELLGAVILSFVFVPQFGPLKGIVYGIFHSVSAFCNAGFDLMGVNAVFSSLTAYAGNILLNVTIMMLIILGGIGFLTWDDMKNHKLRFRKYRLQSKMVLVVTAFLIVLPAVYYYFFEVSDMELTWSEKILGSLFQSVTTRTAGFNTLDFNAMSESGKLITLVLMMIGGAPGSTAGGMKVTTLGVLIVSAVAVFKRKKAPECFGRRFSIDVVTSAAAIFLLYITFALCGAAVISRTENIPLLTALFETVSAIGTVGLTLGITPTLGLLSKIILTLLMFIGRVGGLTFVYVFMSGRMSQSSTLPEEKIIVG